MPCCLVLDLPRFHIRHQSSRNCGKWDRIGVCRLRFPCFELCLVLPIVLLIRCGFYLLWLGLVFADVKSSENGTDLRRPGTIVILIETLNLDGEWLLTVVGEMVERFDQGWREGTFSPSVISEADCQGLF